MSSKPKRPCNYPGCPALITDGRYCPPHTTQAAGDDRATRGSAHERGYGGRWQQYREWFLSQCPLCGDRPKVAQPLLAAPIRPVEEFSRCKAAGLVRAAVIVDHIIPVAGPGDPLFWAAWNHQGLCVACHNRKTARERIGGST